MFASSRTPSPRPSLRVALFLRTLVPLFVVLGGATALTIITLEREVESRMKEDVELVARGLRLPVRHALEREREGSVSQALQSALDIRRVYGAHVYGPEGEHLLSFGAGLPDEPSARLTDLLATGEQVGEYGRTAGRRVYSYFVPLTDTWGQNLGVLQLTRRRSDIDYSIRRLRAQAGGFFLVAMALVSGLILRGHRRAVGEPVEALGTSMARIRGGDRDHRAAVEGPKELAALSRTFNSMLEAMRLAEAELELRRKEQGALRRELAEAEKLVAVGELAGGVAHELGSPLSVIDGTAQRLLRKGAGVGSEATARVHDIRTEVRRMEAIIRQLLEFGRQGAGRVQLIDVEAAVGGAMAATLEETRRRATSVEADGPSPGPLLRADPRRLEAALANLLRNACQAAEGTPGGGRVRVRWNAPDFPDAVPQGSAEARPPARATADDGAHADGPLDHRVIVDVEDNGGGVSDEVASRIFEPFFTTKPTGEGTGLGLAVVHGLVEGMGGTIDVGRSEMGGALFRLRLPRARMPAEGVRAEVGGGAAPERSSATAPAGVGSGRVPR